MGNNSNSLQTLSLGASRAIPSGDEWKIFCDIERSKYCNIASDRVIGQTSVNGSETVSMEPRSSQWKQGPRQWKRNGDEKWKMNQFLVIEY